jgi:molybdopterin/thiamine biosynthesis adenylyltransferase
VILALLSIGCKEFVLIDFDQVEARNCARGAGLLRYGDIGRYKADALADYITDWDYSAKVKVYHQDTRTLGRLFFAGAGAVICGLDNLASVAKLGATLCDTGIPLLRAATQDNNGSVEVALNRPGGACLCCNLTGALTATRASCGARYLEQLANEETPSLPLSTAIAANRLVMELLRLDKTPEEAQNLRYYDTGTQLLGFPLDRNEECPWHDGVIPDMRTPVDVFTLTLRQYFAAYPACDVLEPVADFVKTGWCLRCGSEYPVNRSMLQLTAAEMHCPHCPPGTEPDQPCTIVRQFTRESPRALLDRTLYELGI